MKKNLLQENYIKQAFQITVLTVVFIACIFAYAQLTRPGPLGTPFTLIDSSGKTVTEADIRAKPAAIFFGYTMCPDVCPTTLLELTNWLEKLGPDADKIGVWFFTVDPERDTPQLMHEYISVFSDRIIGVSGDPKKIHAAIESFNIAVEKVDSGDGDYTYNHTAAVLLLNKGGHLRGIIPYQEKDEIAVQKLKSLAESADR
ncbi:MAG: SCO1/SenC family protein [Candidatus Tokpelaia sp. JSC189]|nr:MAG: SCO1/SenC family protein [Candidatus Tokpelaia sp. JSC189]